MGRTMRKRVFIVGLGVTLALGCAAFAVAGGSQQHTKAAPAAQAPKPSPKSAADKTAAALSKIKNARGCRTVGCFNKKINQIIGVVNGLSHDAYDCEVTVPITQYGDYVAT